MTDEPRECRHEFGGGYCWHCGKHYSDIIADLRAVNDVLANANSAGAVEQERIKRELADANTRIKSLEEAQEVRFRALMKALNHVKELENSIDK